MEFKEEAPQRKEARMQPIAVKVNCLCIIYQTEFDFFPGPEEIGFSETGISVPTLAVSRSPCCRIPH